VSTQAGKVPRADQLPADVVEPERLALLLQLPESGGGGHQREAASLLAAATMCLLEMPAAFMSSSGLPDVGSPLTARCAIFGAPSAASASITAAPMPPSG